MARVGTSLKILLASLAAATALVGPTLAASVDRMSLAQTMDYIRDLVTAEGPNEYRTTTRDTASGDSWSYTRRREITAFDPDVAGCSLGFHYRMLEDGAVKVDVEGGVPLREVRSVAVEDLAIAMRAVDAQAGHPTWSGHNEPTVWRTNVVREDGHANAFYFYSRDHALLAARAFKHAAELCGVAHVQLD